MGKSESDGLDKPTYSETVAEVKRLQGLLKMEQEGDPNLPADFNYKNTLFALRYYRIKLQFWKKSERNL